MTFREFDNLLRKACGRYNLRCEAEVMSYVKSIHVEKMWDLGIDVGEILVSNPYFVALVRNGNEVLAWTVVENDRPGFTPTLILRQVVAEQFMTILVDLLGVEELRLMGVDVKVLES